MINIKMDPDIQRKQTKAPIANTCEETPDNFPQAAEVEQAKIAESIAPIKKEVGEYCDTTS